MFPKMVSWIGKENLESSLSMGRNGQTTMGSIAEKMCKLNYGHLTGLSCNSVYVTPICIEDVDILIFKGDFSYIYISLYLVFSFNP